MPRSLVSFWKRVATSGTTADGREILPQELRDIAETYSPTKYTAVIWCEHERWPGSYGTVFAVRLVEEADDLEPGQVGLEAQLKPNDKLLCLNDQGEKLFTSIEITPNFANSGKAYLSGLAVTDSPASLGTQELYFSRKTGEPVHYAASVPLGVLGDEEPKGEIGKLNNLLTRLFKRFAVDDTTTETTQTTPTESNPPMDEATAKALKALIEQLGLVVTGLAAVIEPATVEVTDPVTTEVDDVKEAVDTIVAEAEADREFAKKGDDSKRLDRIEALLEKAFNTTTGQPLPKTTGSTEIKKRVL
ncbi:GPO family capsid scaffolding protein [Pseudomonas sp. PICF141]|uniref:GPO family capsid scaffolding protein n=1 Tax=Pseudomonas sp. PICF141 TaxID=1949067 RepID=UPI000BAB6766|nr:GPO family capsid scaffolding protein [Pseudomonas sp. PICF141]PAU55213.1 capsid scaffolding protein [Pseudomonas sp. PICF141]